MKPASRRIGTLLATRVRVRWHRGANRVYTVYTSRRIFVQSSAEAQSPPSRYTQYTQTPQNPRHDGLEGVYTSNNLDIHNIHTDPRTARVPVGNACVRSRAHAHAYARGIACCSSPCDGVMWYDVHMPDLPPSHVARRANAPKHDTGTNRQRARFLRTSAPAWRAQRQRVLIRDSYQCRACGSWGNEVDHINNDAHRDVTDEELQTLCRKCHSAKTMRELNSR